MNKKGFTLIELLMVIAIIAIISMILVPNVINMISTNKQKSCENLKKNFRSKRNFKRCIIKIIGRRYFRIYRSEWSG